MFQDVIYDFIVFRMVDENDENMRRIPHLKKPALQQGTGTGRCHPAEPATWPASTTVSRASAST